MKLVIVGGGGFRVPQVFQAVGSPTSDGRSVPRASDTASAALALASVHRPVVSSACANRGRTNINSLADLDARAAAATREFSRYAAWSSPT